MSPGRVEELLQQHRENVVRKTNRVFVVLMLAQWALAIFIALAWSPYGWEGKVRSTHAHVWAAIVLGGLISSLPILMIKLKPQDPLTRHVVAAAQMLWSALLIHLSGGRIETHFHVFGSLAFLAFYRDWKLFLTATVMVSADHLARGLLWPESVYGITNPEWWRFLEHAFWVVFENTILVLACFRGQAEMREIAQRQASEEEKSIALTLSQERLVRTEKLAAVGQLAAGVGHELRNPLSAIRNAHTYVSKMMARGPEEAASDPRVKEFMGTIERELNTCSRIISDLLDFARERQPNLGPCPLRPLVDDAIGVVPARANVTIENAVPADLPIPSLDKDQFRQIIVNLVQNAAEAVPADRNGRVVVRAEGGGEAPWRIHVSDDGAGVSPEIRAKIFEPLFTTKTKGTGLGLAIVAGMVHRHSGTIDVKSEVGKGTTFVIVLPPASVRKAA